jgi:hypothetical protein
MQLPSHEAAAKVMIANLNGEKAASTAKQIAT